jgi:hypothetical protein
VAVRGILDHLLLYKCAVVWLHSKWVVALAVEDLTMYGVQNQRLGGRPQLGTNLRH